MEKARFLAQMENYTALDADDASALETLSEKFPYSQMLRVLAARAAQDNGLPNFKSLLQQSAIYCFDRAVLKKLLSDPRGHVFEKSVVVKEVAQYNEQLPLSADVYTSTDGYNSELIESVFSDLAKLKEVKHHFEEVVEEYDRVMLDQGTRGASVEPNEEVLLEQIKKSKKAVKVAEPPQQEQHHIIDQFIRSSPTLTKNKAADGGAPDLSEASSAFGDHIISETLVEILLRQGKKEKAIEVLRKLIWKFPQKKAIFAAQIEDLRK